MKALYYGDNLQVLRDARPIMSAYCGKAVVIGWVAEPPLVAKSRSWTLCELDHVDSGATEWKEKTETVWVFGTILFSSMRIESQHSYRASQKTRFRTDGRYQGVVILMDSEK